MNKPPQIILIALILVGLYLIIIGVRHIFKARAVKKWRQIEGAVTGLTLSHQPTSKGRIAYKPVIEYVYNVDENQFTGSKRCITEIAYGRQHSAEKVLSRYSIGGKVTVFVNPDNPREAFLEPNMSLPLLAVMLIFGPIVLTVGCIGVFT